jgi:hypothetical protein
MDLDNSVKASGFLYCYGEWGTGSQEAQGTLTIAVNPSDGDSIVVDHRSYNFVNTLATDDDIQIGVNAAATKANLVAAFDLSGTAGVDYALNMKAHETAELAAFIVNDAVLTAKVGGSIGNAIVTTSSFTAPANGFDDVTLGTTTPGVDTATFERGNDFSGTGTAKAPYATPRIALQELFTYLINEQSNTFDKNYYLVLLGNNGESNLYDSFIDLRKDNTDTNHLQTINATATAKLIIQGWNKGQGEKLAEARVTSWTDPFDLEKPKLTDSSSGYMYLGENTQGGYAGPVMQFKDVILDFSGYAPEDNSLFRANNWDLSGHAQDAPFQFYGCIFRGGFKNLNQIQSNFSSFAGVVASIYKNSTYRRDVGVNFVQDVFFQNCVFPDLVEGLDMNEANKTDLTLCSCIAVAQSGKIFELSNIGDSPKGNFNIFKRVDSIFADEGLDSYVTFKDYLENASGPTPLYQNNSFELDPLFIDDLLNDYRLQLNSIADFTGGLMPGLSSSQQITDVDSKNWHQYDYLNNLFFDGETEEILTLGTELNLKTRRSCGVFQKSISGVPQSPTVVYPTPQNTGLFKYIVITANKSPQGGTLQAQVINAHDSALKDIVTIKDSLPINITAANNKIDFSEDLGPLLLATITPDIYSTNTLLAEIKTQMEAVGSGTYTVSYTKSSKKYSIQVAGAVSNFQLFFRTGANQASSLREILGFSKFDTANQSQHIADTAVKENHYDPVLNWEYANDYIPGADPALSGTWLSMGVRNPSGAGSPGTDGANGDGTYFIRVNLPEVYGLHGKFIGALLNSGGKVKIV